MSETEISESTKQAIKNKLKYGEVLRKLFLAEVAVASVIVEEKAEAIFKFYTKDGRYIGEVPALDILADKQNSLREGGDID